MHVAVRTRMKAADENEQTVQGWLSDDYFDRNRRHTVLRVFHLGDRRNAREDIFK